MIMANLLILVGINYVFIGWYKTNSKVYPSANTNLLFVTDILKHLLHMYMVTYEYNFGVAILISIPRGIILILDF